MKSISSELTTAIAKTQLGSVGKWFADCLIVVGLSFRDRASAAKAVKDSTCGSEAALAGTTALVE